MVVNPRAAIVCTEWMPSIPRVREFAQRAIRGLFRSHVRLPKCGVPAVPGMHAIPPFTAGQSVIRGAKKFFRIFFSNIQHNRKESIHPA
jgi:hypothetical protein